MAPFVGRLSYGARPPLSRRLAGGADPGHDGAMETVMQIRDFGDDDIATLLGWFDSEAALVQWGGPDLVHPLDRAQVAAMLAQARTSPPGRLMLAGTIDGVVVGHGQVHLDHRHGVARLGRFAIAPERRGAGLARPFLDWLIARAFAVPGMVRLELSVYTHNSAAIRAYEAAGFQREGVRRSSVQVGATRWDTAIYAIVKP